MAKKYKEETVNIDRIFLHEENPRHNPLSSQSDIIEYLCKDELVYDIAKHIARHGLSPLERLGLIEQGQRSNRRVAKTYVVGEGNRRVCALKLLNDPELAPPRLRKRFEQLAQDKDSGLHSIRSVIFKNADDLKEWMLLLHGGLQGGIGRKTWNAEQKARATGARKNRLAQEILDYAESKGMIDANERIGKITTVQRYLSNNNLREAVGLENDDADNFHRNRPAQDFDKILEKFIDDLKSGVVNSRSNKQTINPYARSLASVEGISGDRIDPEPLSANSSKKKKPRRKTKPKKSIKHKCLVHSSDLQTELDRLKNNKLLSIYYSLCKIELEHHTPILAIGLWSFIESLSAKAGRKDHVDFTSYYSADLMKRLGLGEKRKTGPIRQALRRISENGNTTKHHDISAVWDGQQLANDLEVVTPLLVAILKIIPAKN